MTFGIRRTPVTAAILAIIAAVFVLEVSTGALFDERSIIALGAIIPGTLQHHQYWRLVAAMFLHGGWLHLAFNSWAIIQLGALYENMFGSGRFAFMYLATGLVASACSAMHVQGTSVGASGAIFGILGAFIFSIRRSPQWKHERWTKSLIRQLLFLAAVNIVIDLQIPFIDNWAHMGGLVAGLLLGFLPHRVPPPPPGSQIIDVPPYERTAES